MITLAKRIYKFIVRLLARRLRIPLIKLRVPLWALLLIFLVVVIPGGGGILIATNQPIFCNSCHEMSMHYATWRQSAHADVECEECHLMPGTINMFKSKLAAFRQVRLHTAGEVKTSVIQGKVPDENCKHCHPQTRKLITYHGLKITHRDHWELGVKCTYCHDRVAHGPRWQFEGVTSSEEFTEVAAPSKYAPTMEICYTCHDGKQASNKCSTCHVTLGERRPRTFDPAWVGAHREEVNQRGRRYCGRCHQESFCDKCHRDANPHPRSWMTRHHDEADSNPERCVVCHLMPGEPRSHPISEMAFCRACHSLSREHTELNWTELHGKEALADTESCQRCHEPSWCSDCHSISRQHPEEWRIRHASEASRSREGCRVCHNTGFCDACHRGEGGIPQSHENGWLTAHKRAAHQQGSSCQVCHQPDFCHSCHDKHAPEDHQKNWARRHGQSSRLGDSACLICHKQSECDSCHGMQMPHSEKWLKQHHDEAAKQKALCSRCHRDDACSACHRGAFPTSHKEGEWLAAHGRAAQAESANCALCHREELCTACHGLRLPHPDDWMVTHGAEARGAASNCVKCHEPPAEECAACHVAIAPESHSEDNWTKQHSQAGSAAVDLCTLCHGKNACGDCHKKERAGG